MSQIYGVLVRGGCTVTLEQRLQDKVQQHVGTGSSTTDPNAPSVEEQLKQKVEDELKQKLKGLF